MAAAAQARAAGKRANRKVAWVLGTVVMVVVLVVAGSAAYAWHLNREIHRLDVRGLTDVPASGADAGTENILMVGSTDRCALAVQNAAYGLCSQGVNGVNSDVVMILHLDPSTHAVSILSIPRDLFVPNARTTGANKIDAALYQGPSQLVAAINEDLGIPIQHYVVLNFDSFINVVDDLDNGVKMYFPMPVYDAYSGLKQLTPGCVQLTGVEALQVVRARHLQYKGTGVTTPYPQYWPQETLSDLARIRRDHEFLRVLATAVAQQGLSNPVTDERLVSGVAPQLERGPSVLHLGHDPPHPRLPLRRRQQGPPAHPAGAGRPEPGRLHLPGQWLRGRRVPLDHPGPAGHRPVPRPQPVHRHHDRPAAPRPGLGLGLGPQRHRRLQPGLTTSSSLQALGFHMVGVGDTPSVGTDAETVVYFAQKTAADEAAAQAVADSFTGAVVTALGPTTDGAQVTVVTGSQFTVKPPAAAGSGATGASSSTTGPSGASTTTTSVAGPTATTPAAGTTTTTEPSTGDFLPPTAAVTALQPWDPRSCTPQGGEGS